jgi:hypothetical protein
MVSKLSVRNAVILAAAFATSTAAVPAARAQDEAKRTYTTARVAGASPVIDGRADEGCWERVEWSGGFTQSTPRDGAEPTEETAFKVLYDADNLYVLVRLHDREPAHIERRLGRRDAYSGDDVYVQIDSYFDKRTAFGFGVNAAGVKYDAVISSDGASEDSSWDPVWFVATSVDQEGWTAEMRIPFSELRFGDKADHVWGFQVNRWYFRAQEGSTWQHIPQRSAGLVSRYGELHGLAGIKPRALREVVPYAVNRLQRSASQEGNPFATGQSNQLFGGVDGKIGITNDVTLTFTANPDFGQVEADPSVVNLTAFETYYVEKRPFFVEGANIFAMPITSFGTSSGDTLFYSRRIGRPPQYQPRPGEGAFVDQPDQTSVLGAAKLSGKTKNGLSFGLLDTVTSEERAAIDLSGQRSQEVVEPLTNYTVGRVRKDFRQGNSTFGGMFTSVQRRLDHPQLSFLHRAAYTGGMDFAHYWRDKTYYVKGTGVFSHVRGTPEAILRTQMASPRFFQRPDATYLSLDPTRTSLSGHGGSIEAGRSGNSRLILNGSYAWRSPGLELNDIGFQRVADYAVARVQGTYRVFQPFSIFRTFSVEFAPWVNFVNMHEFVGMGGYVAPSAQFRNYWTVMAVCERDGEYLDTMVLRGGPALKVSPYTSVFLALNSDGRKKATFGFNAQHRWDRNREIDSTSLGVTFGYRPSGAFDVSIQPNVSFNRAALQYVGTWQVGSENRYLVSSLDQKTLRVTVRLNYALTPTLSVQYYGQPFVSAGAYSDFKRIADPRAERYEDRFHLFSTSEIASSAGQFFVDEDHDGVTDFSFGRPDFNFRQFRSNLVARWEYSPGSTLYVVWTQDRTGVDPSGVFSVGRDMGELFRVGPRNVFLVKFSRRIAF